MHPRRLLAPVFAASAVLFLILIGVVWLARPVKSAVPVEAGGAH